MMFIAHNERLGYDDDTEMSLTVFVIQLLGFHMKTLTNTYNKHLFTIH